jgi:NAD(P)-dependent dehydrogenase (short-subunit alcohol dehydrogenase family)
MIIYKITGEIPKPVAEASFPDFKRVLEVNVNGTFLVTRLVSAAMKTQDLKQVNASCPERGTTRGAIVNLASMTAYIVVPNAVQYIASKHAVMGITKSAGMWC